MWDGRWLTMHAVGKISETTLTYWWLNIDTTGYIYIYLVNTACSIEDDWLSTKLNSWHRAPDMYTHCSVERWLSHLNVTQLFEFELVERRSNLVWKPALVTWKRSLSSMSDYAKLCVAGGPSRNMVRQQQSFVNNIHGQLNVKRNAKICVARIKLYVRCSTVQSQVTLTYAFCRW